MSPVLPREERDAIRALHRQSVGGGFCTFCCGDWPCTTIRLLDDLDAAEAENARLRSALDHLREDDALNRDAYLLVEAQRDEARAALAACARGCVMCGSAFRALAADEGERTGR